MAPLVLIHGGGGSAWDWHLVVPALRERGHDVVAVDLPTEDASAGLEEYAGAVVDAIGDRCELVVVAHSFGGFTAPLVCARVPVELLVLLAAMVPAPGEPPAEWWANTAHEQADPSDEVIAAFLHDVSPELAAEALAHERRLGGHSDGPAVAARCVAGRGYALPALPRRPLLPRRVAARRRARAPRRRSRRDRRQPLRLPQPAASWPSGSTPTSTGAICDDDRPTRPSHPRGGS